MFSVFVDYPNNLVWVFLLKIFMLLRMSRFCGKLFFKVSTTSYSFWTKFNNVGLFDFNLIKTVTLNYNKHGSNMSESLSTYICRIFRASDIQKTDGSLFKSHWVDHSHHMWSDTRWKFFGFINLRNLKNPTLAIYLQLSITSTVGILHIFSLCRSEK